MKSLFITGGSGTVGRAIIERNIKNYKIFSFSRNEKSQIALKRTYPEIEILFGSVEEKIELLNAINIAKPKIIIHAAALKHVDTAEKQPSLAIKSNILGSLNVIQASIENDVDLTVGISSHTACAPDNVYGHTKFLMEQLFREHDHKKNRFICCRFGNVAWSNGSILPFWFGLKSENKSLPVTSKEMTRLIFTSQEAAMLIEKAIDLSQRQKEFYTLSKKMKKVNMLRIAKMISDNFEIIGLRPGEIESEDLISQEEVPFTKEIEDDYLIITPQNEVTGMGKLTKPLSSSNAREMSTSEMKNLLESVDARNRTTTLDERRY